MPERYQDPRGASFGPGSRASTEPAAKGLDTIDTLSVGGSLGPPGFDPSRVSDPAATHREYGPCDGFGPLWTCSACTGVIARDDGTFVSEEGRDLTMEEAAASVGDFLIERAEMAAVAAFGCCSDAARIAEFVRVSLILPFPGEPWRRPALFERATDETRSGDSGGGA